MQAVYESICPDGYRAYKGTKHTRRQLDIKQAHSVEFSWKFKNRHAPTQLLSSHDSQSSSLLVTEHHNLLPLTVVRRFRSIAHVVYFAILHLPDTILQYPDVIASIEDAESLADIVQSSLDPVRPGDAGGKGISVGLTPLAESLVDLLGVHPRFLRSDEVQHQKVGDKMGSPRSIAGSPDGSHSLFKTAGLAAVWTEISTVVDNVLGHDFIEGGIVLAVDQPGCLVPGLGEGFDC